MIKNVNAGVDLVQVHPDQGNLSEIIYSSSRENTQVSWNRSHGFRAIIATISAICLCFLVIRINSRILDHEELSSWFQRTMTPTTQVLAQLTPVSRMGFET